MKLSKIAIVSLFRGLWVILAMVLLLFIIAQNVFTKRSLVYKIDFKDSVSRDHRGWYPESRVSYDQDDNRLNILGEPIYMKLYLPVKFDVLSITGSWSTASTTLKLGLKQIDESWFYKDIDQKDWSANFDLAKAKVYRNQIEIMISMPDYQVNPNQNIFLDNNWQFEFKR